MNARPIRNQPSQLLEMLTERERPVRPGMIHSAYGGTHPPALESGLLTIRRLLATLRRKRTTCPHCTYSYYWEATEPSTCDGCGYPTTHLED